MKIWNFFLKIFSKHTNETAPRKVFILGQQLADAREKERQRQTEFCSSLSPMPKSTYSQREKTWLLNPIKTTLDQNLREIYGHFSKLNAVERDNFRKRISMDEFYTLLTFSRRQAVFALRENSPEILRASLGALAMIELDRIDNRDISFMFGLPCHSAIKIGLDFDKEISQAAELSEPKVRSVILGLASTFKNHQDIAKSWGYMEVKTPSGPGFVRHDINSYKPKIDLLNIALDIVDLVEKDKYHSDCPEVGAKIPDIWFGDKVSDVKSQIDTLVGTVHINTSLNDQYDEKAWGQKLLIWLTETSDYKIASHLFEIARLINPKSYSLLTVCDNNLFCVVVARSVVMGLKPFENGGSLIRFESGVREALQKGLLH
jgi:hypothetical protein